MDTEIVNTVDDFNRTWTFQRKVVKFNGYSLYVSKRSWITKLYLPTAKYRIQIKVKSFKAENVWTEHLFETMYFKSLESVNRYLDRFNAID